MNVLLLTDFFSPAKGGGEYVFTLIAQLLAENGHKVWVITNRLEGTDYQHHKNIRNIFVSSPLPYQGGMPVKLKDKIRYIFPAVRVGLSLIKREKIDIIHSNPFVPALVGSILSLLKSKPHIVVIHDIFSIQKGFWSEWAKQKGISKLDVFLGPLLEKIIIKLKCSAIHTVSEATKDDLVKFGAKKPIYVIHNAVHIDKIEESKSDPCQFIYIGRLVFYKNLEVVIRAVNILKESYSNLKLVITGDGPHKKKLVELIENLNLKEKVIFKGHVSEEEKRRLLATSAAMVFPSTCEGFGLVMLEAFAFKKPVIVSDVRPLSDVVENNKTGLIVSASDEKEWAEALVKIIKDPNMTNKMGRAGKELLEEKYSLEIMKGKLFTMYNDLIKNKS